LRGQLHPSPWSSSRFLGMVNAAMTPIVVCLGAVLVNRVAEASSHKIPFSELVPVVIGFWIVATFQRTISAYMEFARNLFVRRVELEVERRLLAKASKVDIGNFDNSNWYDRLARAKRDV
jgi:ATP-binding cassette, subfamily B, bacterial